MTVTIADELTILALDPVSGTPRGTWPELGLAGALLAELLLDGRAYLDDNGLVVSGQGDARVPYDDPDLERLAQEITDRSEHSEHRHGWFTVTSPPRELVWWLARLTNDDVDTRRRDSLQERGLVVATEDTRGIVVTYGHRPSDPAARAGRVRQLADVLTGSAPPDPRAVTLLSLIRAVGLERALFAGVLGGRPDPEIVESMTTDAVAMAVREVIVSRRRSTQAILMGGGG